ncbi:MAG: hypothetical protein KBC84_05030 [Proteobacteria bacterium]|nr:hypothetical protein [Pseudomonadota bacterium]
MAPEFALRSELANQGIMPLSSDNPYLAGNLFVAKEIDNSNNFKGFIHHRGTPDAVEIKKDLLQSYKVYLYYLKESEIYVMEQTQDWLIKGPAKISPQLMQSFFSTNPSGQKAPLINSLEETELALPPTKMTPYQEPKIEVQKPETKKPKLSLKKEEKLNPLVIKKSKKSENQAAQVEKKEETTVEDESSKADLKESVSGDVNYKVEKNGQDLSDIVKWYTGSANNTGRVARINGIEEIHKLSVNQVVRIPRYLLKTTKPLQAP